MQDSFIFYRSYIESIEDLDEHERIQLLEAIIYYSIDSKQPVFDQKYLYNIFKMALPNLNNSIKKYNNAIESGRKGGQYSKKYNDDEIIKMYDDGMTQKEISEKLGCHINTIKNAIKNKGTDNGGTMVQTTDRQRTDNGGTEYRQRTDNDKHLYYDLDYDSNVDCSLNQNNDSLSTSTLDYTEEKKPEGGEGENIIVYYADSYDELTYEQQSYIARKIAIMKPKSEKPKDQDRK